jgi:serine/threonine-protein kinase
MSSVYAATHRNGKQVAIKVLRPDMSNRERTKWRFLREGSIANRIDHVGVVTVLDDINENGIVFLVMERLEGVTVEQYCCERGGSLAVGEVLAIADGVLDILNAAHAAGVVHRDIKPSNLFLTTQEALKLLDFGIASLREAPGVANATINGVLLGTPGFMAPEQARGRWKEIDARTDLWGVGALMFRLLTGRLVHEAETTHESVVAAATLPARSLGSAGALLNESLVALVDRALKSDPGARWQSAVEMQAAVRNERACWPSCGLPRPSRRAPVATLDEARSVAGTANELPIPGERVALARLKRSLRWGPSFAYGALGAVVFLWIVTGRAEKAVPASLTLASTVIERSPKESALPSPPANLVPGAISTSAPSIALPLAAVARSAQSANAPAATLIQRNERRMTKPLPFAAGSATPAPPSPSPRRLEDVLDERN